jgi:hypothetical protein
MERRRYAVLEREIKRLLDDGVVRSESHSVLIKRDLSARLRKFIQPYTWREHRDARGYVVRYQLRQDLREWPGGLSSIAAHSGRGPLVGDRRSQR